MTTTATATRLFTPDLVPGAEYPGETLDDGRAVMALTAADADRWADLPRRRDVGWLLVTDQNTGTQWEVRPASCGAGCFCAAEARRPHVHAGCGLDCAR